MITIRKAEDRGHANHGWLDSYHTFSFGNYYDPKYMGFRSLRVINEDRVNPGAGFNTHGHRDMEIITYVLEGALEHKDSLGTGSVIYPGEIQKMSAGIGITHSEFNHSKSDLVHFLQIWIIPDTKGLEASYEQQKILLDKASNNLKLIATQGGKDGVVNIHQDVNLYAGILAADETISYQLQPQRYAWFQVARGAIYLNEIQLNTSDGAAISEESNLIIKASENAEFLLFDLA